MTMSMFRRILFLTPLAIAAMQSSFAASPSVTAVLSNSQPAVGQIVQLEIKISGANKAKVPESISVDGLEIHQTGQMYESSLSFGFGGNEGSSSVTYTYSVLPLKAGQFNIPPQTVRVGNDSLRTAELVLNVAQGSRGSAGSRQSGQTQVASKLAFAELVVAKKDAYVGEMVPAEIRTERETAHVHVAQAKGETLEISKIGLDQGQAKYAGGYISLPFPSRTNIRCL